MAKMQLDIVSRSTTLFSQEVRALTVFGSEGDLGIHPGHGQLLTLLKPGEISITTEDGQCELFYVSGGILEVQPQQVTVLADTFLRADELDEEAAEKMRANAQEAMTTSSDSMDTAAAMTQLAEAAAQLRLLRKARKAK